MYHRLLSLGIITLVTLTLAACGNDSRGPMNPALEDLAALLTGEVEAAVAHGDDRGAVRRQSDGGGMKRGGGKCGRDDQVRFHLDLLGSPDAEPRRWAKD